MKVAIVHEMLVKLGGAENVVLDILEMFPEADLFTLIYDEEKVGRVFPISRIKQIPSITQRIYKWTHRQRLCLPFLSRAVESLDLSEYDLVIASSSGFAHGCITKPETLFMVYYHSPARYLWDWTNEYKRDIGFGSGIKKVLLNKFMLKARLWDYLAGQRHDVAIAASKQVVSRISKYYRRESEVIYPAVWVEDFEIGEKVLKDREYYVITSALTEFKKVELSIKAFNTLGYQLKIIGAGNQLDYLKSIAEPNIEFLGHKNHNEIRDIYLDARGFIMSGRDDFGIAPIEAMAAGIPVFALREGGLVETNVEGLSGEFFDKADGSDFIGKFNLFHNNISENKYDRIKIRNHAMKFNKARFITELKETIEKYI
ncbi:MAG: glycosyltransferase [Candidatus Gracilibacteria bacterium]|nr:glycosyltransferase [Candidatus Gracilibacteria bacterium]MDD2908804.1 glycosyltransferase [Candidatus Gracilibacteria bacterium]